MAETLSFKLLDIEQPVSPILKLTRDIQHKDYILTVEFIGTNSEIRKETVPTGLLWSSSLDCPFVYLPDAKAPQTLRLTEFAPPAGAKTATLTIRPWASRAHGMVKPYSSMVLQTTIIGRPSVIIGNEA